MDHRNVNRAAGISIVGALVALSAQASAQAPAINFALGVQMRLENAVHYDSATQTESGETKLVLNTHLDTYTEGPFVVTLEQARRVLATGSCTASPVVYSGEVQDGQGYLDECATNVIPSSSIRTNEPVDVVVALVDDATDVRTELYRGTFPVIGFTWWVRNDGDRPIHVEQRALRLDSYYGAAFARQYIGGEIQFTYVTTQSDGAIPSESAMRCRVDAGEWRAYPISLYETSEQVARNRVWVDGTVHEDGLETVRTKFIHFSGRMPIAIANRGVTPSAGSSMDGDWTCELRFGGAGTRVVAREFRFHVTNGYVVPHALEAQLPPGRGTVMMAIGMNPEQMPEIFDPALVRDTIAGHRLTGGATAPLVSPMPARAVNPSFTAARGAPAAAGGRGGRGGRR